MVIPSTILGLVVLVVLVIPGAVYAAVRNAVGGIGSHDRDIGVRVLRAIIASAILNAIYLLVGGSWLIDLFSADGVTSYPRQAAALGLVLGAGAPALIAYIVHGKPRIARGNLARVPRLPWPARTTGHISTPTAWDLATTRTGGRFVRIRLEEGKWVGGWYGDRSVVSTYPEAHEMYVEEQHEVAEDGTFGEAIEGSSGFWLALEPGNVVEWVEVEE